MSRVYSLFQPKEAKGWTFLSTGEFMDKLGAILLLKKICEVMLKIVHVWLTRERRKSWWTKKLKSYD